jgi:hypothetical protein
MLVLKVIRLLPPNRPHQKRKQNRRKARARLRKPRLQIRRLQPPVHRQHQSNNRGAMKSPRRCRNGRGLRQFIRAWFGSTCRVVFSRNVRHEPMPGSRTGGVVARLVVAKKQRLVKTGFDKCRRRLPTLRVPRTFEGGSVQLERGQV